MPPFPTETPQGVGDLPGNQRGGEENKTLIRGSSSMSKSWAGVVHGQQGGSDTQRSPASQETRKAWCHHVYLQVQEQDLDYDMEDAEAREQKQKE